MPSFFDTAGRFSGKLEKLWVSATDPGATPTAPGSYTLVGFLTGNPFDGNTEYLEAEDKDAGQWGEGVPNGKTFEVGIEAYRKKTGDTGQLVVRDAWLNGTRLWFLIGTGITGDQCVHGKVDVSSYGQSSPGGDWAGMSATLRGAGTPSFTTHA